MTDVLNPTNDYVFKRLFADAPELLVQLINDLRPQAPPLAQLSVINPEIAPSEIQGKLIRLDVLAKDEHGGQYNVEIQVYRYKHWHQRGLFYLSRLMASQLQAGVPYKALQANVGMHLLDFDLFTSTDAERAQARWCFEMRDAEQPQVSMGDVLQLNLLELSKAAQLGGTAGALGDWVAFFKQWQENWKMTNIEHKPVLAAMEKVRALSQDEREWAQAWSRDKALRDEISMRDQERSEGKAEGFVKGKAEGKAEGKVAALRDNLAKLTTAKFGALPASIQRHIEEGSEAELSQWFDQVLVAEQMTDVWH